MGIGRLGIGSRGIGQAGIGDSGIPSTPDFFGITIDTTKAGSASDTMIIPLVNGQAYNFSISWGDGDIETFTSSALTSVTHVYSAGGVFEIKITGAFPRIFFNNLGDKLKLLDISNWGNITWSNMTGAFYGCSNLTSSFLDIPNITGILSINSIFRECPIFNADLSRWDMSTVTDMGSAFRGCSVFNSDVSLWDVSSVGAMGGVFRDCLAFSSDVSNWQMGNVSSISSSFRGSLVFNSDVSNWDVSGITSMTNAFRDLPSFNPDLSIWNVSNVTVMTNILNGSGLSTANYDLLLNAWSLLTLNSSVNFGVGTTTYTIATSQTARDILTNAPNTWTIADGGGV